MFAAFAFAHFMSALVRGVTATLAPHLSGELGLSAGDLGLLAGAYFLGFAAMQLPMGSALDRYGPRRVLLSLLALAGAGSIAFALAPSFVGLALARALIGVGVSACLMAPMTSFRRRLPPALQMRANPWMLMTGSLGMVASTLPVEWLIRTTGWRGLFGLIAALMLLAMAGIARFVPADSSAPCGAGLPGSASGYGAVFRQRVFIAFAPVGFFLYGGLIAVQALWAGPWMVRVGGATPLESARGLLGINLSMLASFFAWGFLAPRLEARGWSASRLIGWGAPIGLAALSGVIWLGPAARGAAWALYCVSNTVVTLSLPAVGLAFHAGLAGRALSAYNLVVFSGVFALQWGIGLVIDVLEGAGWGTVGAFRGAFSLFAVCCSAAYLWFLVARPRVGPLHP